MSPWVDLECASESIDSKAVEDPWVTKSLLKSNAARYLRKGDDARHPLASPLYADLRGAAPLLIQVGTAEILFDDSIRLAQVLGKANCGVRLDIWPQMLHGWQHFFPAIPEGRAALAGGCEFLQTHFNLAEYA
jgi:acetyl esterase/lipase